MLAVPNGDGDIKSNKFSRKSISGTSPAGNKFSSPEANARVPNGKKKQVLRRNLSLSTV